MTSLTILSTAAGVLSTMIRQMGVTSSYPTSDWVESTLKPIFRIIAKHMDHIDSDIKTNDYEDWVTRTVTACLIIGVCAWCGFLTFKQIQTTKTIGKMTQALQILADKNQVVRRQDFPCKFWLCSQLAAHVNEWIAMYMSEEIYSQTVGHVCEWIQ